MDTKSWIRGRVIGSGSFGTVSLANDKITGRVFAVKSVSSTSSPPLSILSLENEIEILKMVSSTHIVSYLGDDTTKEANSVTRRNLHMEFVSGGTVAELAAKRGGLEEREVRGYARCLTHALHYLHSVAGVMHGDVKGHNLLVGSGPNGAKLSDFGSAKHLVEVEQRVNLIGGTPYWMAPEVARGEKPGPASDVWSLGCTIIEMVTGTHPWTELGLRNTEVAGFLLRIGYNGISPKYPANLSTDGKDFLDKCLKLNPIERGSCEKLLLHPFLTDMAETESTGPSPRGVLDWDNEEFGDEMEEHGFELEFGGFEEEVSGFAMERLRSLCSEEESLEWNSDGWETVRWDQQEQEQERTVWEVLDFERDLEESVEMSGEGVSELLASGNWVWQERSNFSCSTSTSTCNNCDCGGCFSRDCCCCKSGLVDGPIGSSVCCNCKGLFIFYYCMIMIIIILLSVKLARLLMMIIKLYLQFMVLCVLLCLCCIFLLSIDERLRSLLIEVLGSPHTHRHVGNKFYTVPCLFFFISGEQLFFASWYW